MRTSSLTPRPLPMMEADGWPVGRPADVFARLLSGDVQMSGGTGSGLQLVSQPALSGHPDGLESGVQT